MRAVFLLHIVGISVKIHRRFREEAVIFTTHQDDIQIIVPRNKAMVANSAQRRSGKELIANTVLAAYGNDYLTQDIELALRIEKMSKEDKKGGNYLVSESSDEPSSEASAGASGSVEESGASVTDSDASASSDSGEAGNSNVLPWIIGGVLAVAAVAVGVIFGRKKK